MGRKLPLLLDHLQHPPPTSPALISHSLVIVLVSLLHFRHLGPSSSTTVGSHPWSLGCIPYPARPALGPTCLEVFPIVKIFLTASLSRLHRSVKWRFSVCDIHVQTYRKAAIISRTNWGVGISTDHTLPPLCLSFRLIISHTSRLYTSAPRHLVPTIFRTLPLMPMVTRVLYLATPSCVRPWIQLSSC